VLAKKISISISVTDRTAATAPKTKAWHSAIHDSIMLGKQILLVRKQAYVMTKPQDFPIYHKSRPGMPNYCSLVPR